jgi:type I restriction enzyme R subunit
LTNILENYAQIVDEPDPKTGKKKRKQVWPRYHQLSLVHHALADVRTHGAGQRSSCNTRQGAANQTPLRGSHTSSSATTRDHTDIFDSVIVVTDRRILDSQIQATIKQFMQVGATVGHAQHSGDLRKFIEQGKKIIVSTVQKFPFYPRRNSHQRAKNVCHQSSTKPIRAKGAKRRQPYESGAQW